MLKANDVLTLHRIAKEYARLYGNGVCGIGIEEFVPKIVPYVQYSAKEFFETFGDREYSYVGENVRQVKFEEDGVVYCALIGYTKVSEVEA